MEPPEDIGRLVWDARYRDHAAPGGAEPDLPATWRRVARALASVEARDAAGWEARFLGLMQDCRFLPGGRILSGAGAGAGRAATLFNCFVMGAVVDSAAGIRAALREAALTLRQGGGVGCDFSTLRPAGRPAGGVGAAASGPLSCIQMWDGMCRTLLSTSPRRGAMMATLRCDHPDVEAFVDAKREPGSLTQFDLSVLVSDAFMRALERDADWPLVFPADPAADAPGQRLELAWPGGAVPAPCRVWRTLPARDLWRHIMRAAYDRGEPGVLFIDRINRENSLSYRETIHATNPCGEQPLPPYGACNLGALNLTRYVRRPFARDAELDLDGLAQAAGLAVRLLDNVIDLSRYPLPAQAAQARGARRIGLGITGLADALVMLGLRYDSEAGRAAAAAAMRGICLAAYRASVDLARERGAFPWLARDAYLAGGFASRLPADLRDAIARHGIRNSHLTTIAPGGSISLLAGNVSSGVEPIYRADDSRTLRGADGQVRRHRVSDYACRLWRRDHAGLPPALVEAHALLPADHLSMPAALQPWVDSSISKTVNVPVDCGFDAFQSLFAEAYRLGLKGCTAFRPAAGRGQVLGGCGAGCADR